MAAGLVTATTAVGALVITRSGTSNRSGSPSLASKEIFGTFGAFGIAYGTRASRLLARFGTPEQRNNGCWIYRVRGGSFRGIKLSAQEAGMDAVRYCFFSGVVAIIENHWPPGVRNNSLSGEWLAPLTYGCGGGPCKVRV